MAKKTAKSAPTAAVSATKAPAEIRLADVKAGLSEDKVVFRLIHFWHARNPNKGGILKGLELLFIDEKGTVIQAFISPNRIGKFEGSLKCGSIYSLTNFFATANKTMYRVSDHPFTICFTDTSVLSGLDDFARLIDPDRFRFYSFEQFEASCDRRGDLYDIIGHVKLINGISVHQLCSENFLAESDNGRVSIHLQPKDGPILNICLWDKVAAEFRAIVSSHDRIPSVLLVTTLNPKKRGGRVILGSMSPTRVFFDRETLPTTEYLQWLSTQDADQTKIDASQVVKVETLTIAEIQEFLKTQPVQKATFTCKATIDHIKAEAGWYYVGCTGCNKKVTKGEKTLVCHKCDNTNATAAIMYRLEYSVHDKENEATFVFLDEAGSKLIGRKAPELIDEYVQENGNTPEGEDVPLPECLSDVLGQTYMFELRLSEYNFRSTRQTFTVSKSNKPIEDDDSGKDPVDDEADVERSPVEEGTSGVQSEIQCGEGSVFRNELPCEGSKRPRRSS